MMANEDKVTFKITKGIKALSKKNKLVFDGGTSQISMSPWHAAMLTGHPSARAHYGGFFVWLSSTQQCSRGHSAYDMRKHFIRVGKMGGMGNWSTWIRVVVGHFFRV